MRLTRQQIDTLTQATRLHFGDRAKIWLFGSRVDDNKTGGDIDLYIETDKETGVIEAKLEMLIFLEEMFGEQKIDILVRRGKQECSAMHEIAKSSGIELV